MASVALLPERAGGSGDFVAHAPRLRIDARLFADMRTARVGDSKGMFSQALTKQRFESPMRLPSAGKGIKTQRVLANLRG